MTGGKVARDVALFLDFDGTLVELAPTPDTIAPREGLADALTQLARRLDGACALVSGRAVDDIAAHLDAMPLAAAGSHGADVRDESGVSLGAAPTAIPAVAAQFMERYAHSKGLRYEEKPHGAALHYREDPSLKDAAHDVVETLAARHGLTAQSGKCVVELIAGDADKGSAVRTFMKAPPFAGKRPFFIGDDLTDEAGFAACEAFGGAGILVGSREDTAARYRLPDVASVHSWLEI